MKLLTNNFATITRTTLTGANISFPIANMYANQLVTKTIFTDLVIDMGAPTKITDVSFIGDSIITLEANTADSWGSPAFTMNVSKTYYGIDETYRYWRINTGSSTVYANLLYLGRGLQFTAHQTGATPDYKSTDISNTSIGGQIYTTKGIDLQEWEWAFNNMDSVDYELLKAWYLSDDRASGHVVVQWEDTEDETGALITDGGETLLFEDVTEQDSEYSDVLYESEDFFGMTDVSFKGRDRDTYNIKLKSKEIK